MIGKLRYTAAAACIALASVQAYAADPIAFQDPARDVDTLRAQGLLDATLQRQVNDVLQVLVASARRWPRGQVNGPYSADALNVYLVKDQVAIRGTMRAHPPQRVIVADARYVAELKAATEIYFESLGGNSSVKMADTMVAAITEGPDRAVRSRLGQNVDYREDSNSLFNGAVAFLLAHEMGHIELGLAPETRGNAPRLQGRDRDRVWACESLVGDYVNRRRREEAEADAYAMRLLGAIPDPKRKGLRYELGTMYLQTAQLGMVTATLAALSPDANQRALAAGVGVSPSASRAMGEGLSREAGMIQTAFPASHPSQVDRMFEIVRAFARNPASTCCRDLDDANHRRIWDMLVRTNCGSIGGGAGTR